MPLDENEEVISSDEMFVFEPGDDGPADQDEVLLDMPDATPDDIAKGRGDYLEEPEPEKDPESEPEPGDDPDPEPAPDKDKPDGEGDDPKPKPDDPDPEPDPEPGNDPEDDPKDDPQDEPGDDPEPGAADPGNVPYGRFAKKHSDWKKSQEENQQLKARLEALEKGDPPPAQQQQAPAPGKQFDLKAKVLALEEARVDGDVELAAEINMEIMEHQQEQSDISTAQAVQKANIENDVQSVIGGLLDRHQKFFTDPNEGNTNIARFNHARDGFMQIDGMSFADAMAATEKQFFPKADPKPDADPEPAPDPQEKAKAEQKAAAVKKNADAANRQPPAPNAGQGLRKDRPAQPKGAFDLSDKDYNQLPEKDKQAGRGDVVA